MTDRPALGPFEGWFELPNNASVWDLQDQTLILQVPLDAGGALSEVSAQLRRAALEPEAFEDEPTHIVGTFVRGSTEIVVTVIKAQVKGQTTVTLWHLSWSSRDVVLGEH